MTENIEKDLEKYIGKKLIDSNLSNPDIVFIQNIKDKYKDYKFRVIKPHQVYRLDYRNDRINLHIDDNDIINEIELG
jgi:hypothetical protein